MEYVVAITAIGCGTAVVLTFIDKVFGNKQKQLQAQQRAVEEHARLLEDRLADERRHNDQLARQNDQLQKQVEWHGKLLETQDRLLNQLGDSRPGERPSLPERAAVR